MSDALLTSHNPAMRRVLMLAEGVAAAPTTVLLCGESGTGKEVLARFIHEASPRASRPFVAVNCAAIPAALMESELFGHEKGAFSGATSEKRGHFEMAAGGTILLDEVSELPFELQAKLLRVLQERQVVRVGGSKTIELDVRVIATTNKDLGEMVRQGTFRQDLFYRVNVFPITIPALRSRIEDLPDLCRALVGRLAVRLGRPVPRISEAAVAALAAHDFPGNVRELQNLLERALVMTDGPVLHADALLFDRLNNDTPSGILFDGLTLAEIERRVILDTLARQEGNRTKTAELLGIALRTLRNKLRDYRVAGFEIAEAQLGVAA